MKDYQIAIIIVLIFLGTFTITLSGLVLLDKNVFCPNDGKAMQLESKYVVWGGGCYVNYNNQWLPVKNVAGVKLN